MGGTKTSGRRLWVNFGANRSSMRWARWKRCAAPTLLVLLAACGTVTRTGRIPVPSTPQSSSATPTSAPAPVIPAGDEDAGGRSVFGAADNVPQLSIVDLPAIEAGKGAEGHVIGDDYPYKGKAPDSAFDPWKEYVRECTSFVAWRLHSVNGFEMPFFDNATGWGPKARARHFQVDGTPGIGSVAWWASGHVAWVAAIDGNSVTIEEYNHVPFAYSTRTITIGYKGVQYIHFADLPNTPAVPAPAQPAPTQATPATTALQGGAPALQGGSPSLQGSSQNLQGGAPAGSGGDAPGPNATDARPPATPPPTPAPTPPPTPRATPPATPAQTVAIPPPTPPATPAPTPTLTPAPTQAPAPTPAPTSAPQTFTETVGGVSNTWTNYQNAGGTAGQKIPAFTSVQVSCRVEGFRVADGDTWWYRVASAPWNGAFYVSADVFYNNGQTSGSLHGTPFFDPAVPVC